MGNDRSRSYWKRRYEKDKAAQVNRTEDYIRKEQQKLYGQAAEEIRREIETLYQRSADSQDITLAQAKQLVRDADFKKIDFEAMAKESLKLKGQMKDKSLPEEVLAAVAKQHKDLEAEIAAYSRRGRISYLELKSLEIDRILVSLYDKNQAGIYDYLASEWEDGYYRQIFNTQQYLGFGMDFVRPNEEAVRKAVMNRYDKKDYSRRLYAHCRNFSKDLKENLTVGLIRGENLDKMAGRIHKRMGVALSAAKTLVRTETAYVFEQATMDAYEKCGIEWYEYLATLDLKTTPMCQELDGKHFKVKDALPGKNCPPMHPNCRSTTLCWFPEEEGKKAETERIAKNEEGKYYSVPADMTYPQWKDTYGVREYRYAGRGNLADNVKQAAHIHSVVSSMSRKVREALKDVKVVYDDHAANGYHPDSRTIYLKADVPKKIIEHEAGHAVEGELFDEEKVRLLKQKLTSGMTLADIRIRKGDMGNGRTEDIFVIDSPDFIDTYQGRIYADSIEECVDGQGKIEVDRMKEFISVAYQYYLDHPKVMAKRFPEMYRLVKESVE